MECNLPVPAKQGEMFIANLHYIYYIQFSILKVITKFTFQNNLVTCHAFCFIYGFHTVLELIFYNFTFRVGEKITLLYVTHC